MDMATVTAMDMAMDMEKINNKNTLTIAVDFDGTIVEHKYPAIGKEKPFAIDTLKSLADDGHRLILWTARDGNLLDDAIDYCRKRGLEFYAVNSSHPAGYLFQGRSDKSHKVIADIYIDDHNLGGLPDWGDIYEMITGIQAKRSKKRHRRPFWKRWFKR